MDPRKRRRAEARLAALQRDLNRFRASYYIAIAHGDPLWVKRCHKAIREQQEKIQKLRAEHGLDRPQGALEVSA